MCWGFSKNKLKILQHSFGERIHIFIRFPETLSQIDEKPCLFLFPVRFFSLPAEGFAIECFPLPDHCESVFDVSVGYLHFFIVVFMLFLTFLVLELNHNYWVPQTSLFSSMFLTIPDVGVRMIKRKYFLH